MPSPAPRAPDSTHRGRSIRVGIALLPLAPAADHSHPLEVVA
ncbi:hypothetical protein ACN6K4_006281 [Streptomyces hayashii]